MKTFKIEFSYYTDKDIKTNALELSVSSEQAEALKSQFTNLRSIMSISISDPNEKVNLVGSEINRRQQKDLRDMAQNYLLIYKRENISYVLADNAGISHDTLAGFLYHEIDLNFVDFRLLSKFLSEVQKFRKMDDGPHRVKFVESPHNEKEKEKCYCGDDLEKCQHTCRYD